MKNELTIISEAELHQIHGGHGSFSTGSNIVDSAIFILGLAHVVVGVREFANWGIDTYNGDIEENDHFTQFFVGCKNAVVGCFK